MDFTVLLKENGLKSTPQRTAVLSEIYMAGHIDIEKLHENIISKIKIPLGTLYRIISELSSAGILTSLAINGLKTHYEIKKHSHSHIVCDSCGKVIDIDYLPEEIIKKLNITNSFSISNISLTAHGKCIQCF